MPFDIILVWLFDKWRPLCSGNGLQVFNDLLMEYDVTCVPRGTTEWPILLSEMTSCVQVS